MPMVCLSRISPIRITSGAWRSAFFSATSNALVSVPTSRWFTIDFLFWKMNSTGSSSVRMWPDLRSLRKSSIDESEVDLPEPVGQAEGIERRDRAGNEAHHHRRSTFLAERADAERADVLEGIGGVQLHLL